ncbi:MAG: ceramidase [Myxococcota bacterium]
MSTSVQLGHEAASTATGYWTSQGAPASVDWCEPNYAWSPWIAEFFNVLSSAPMVVIGLLALWRLHRSARRTEPRFILCFLGLTVVGVGSMAFHATLLQVAQALDELPMVYCSLVMTYCVVVRTKDAQRDAALLRRWQLGFTVYAVGFTAAYFSSEDYFALFIGSFAAVVTYLVIQGWRVVYRLSASPSLQRLYLVAAIAFVTGVALFWLPERSLGCAHPLQATHLHAWWHLLAMVGTYVGFLLVVFDRLTTLDQEPALIMGAVPWVAPRK